MHENVNGAIRLCTFLTLSEIISILQIATLSLKDITLWIAVAQLFSFFVCAIRDSAHEYKAHQIHLYLRIHHETDLDPQTYRNC